MMDLAWDPEVESPATIAIIGGGPVGIEAGIYARFLGYFVSIIEQHRIGHRMLDWHDRPLAVNVEQCTTTLGHAAILAQYPEYQQRPPDHRYTGRSYAEEYLIPLAKNDLLFDGIHFLSPVTSVSRVRTHVSDAIVEQERCNDEFRLLVEGRHRGHWIARADIVMDCRGASQTRSGMGPGGGHAIGERELMDSFVKHTPLDRKFELKQIAGKRICLVGLSIRACQFATEFCDLYGDRTDMKLFWIVRTDHRHDSQAVVQALEHLREKGSDNVIVLESLGVEQVLRNEAGIYSLRLLSDDDSSVDIECDAVASFTQCRETSLSHELKTQRMVDPAQECSFITQEPGYYILSGGCIEQGAGVGLSKAFDDIRRLFAMISGREDLNLYDVLKSKV
jgi:hypothetical protein